MATKGTRYTPGAFEARIYSIGQLRCVDIPRSISDAFGASARVPVRVRIGRLEEQSSLVPKRDGGHRLYIAAGLRRMPPLDSGDRVRIKIWRDPRGGEPVLPDDLLAAFRRVSGGMAALLARVGGYSKGMVQKLGLVSCFMLDRKLLILDEPLNGLDPRARYHFKQLLREERSSQQTILYSTHLLADAEDLCDQFGILHDGEMKYQGTPDDCMRSYQADSLEQAYMRCISTEG